MNDMSLKTKVRNLAKRENFDNGIIQTHRCLMFKVSSFKKM